jgi:hypothetical protein
MTATVGYTEKILLIPPRSGINGKLFHYDHVHLP